MRLGWKDRAVHRRAPAKPSLALHPVHRRRAVHPRNLSDRRVSGNSRRSSQPVRRHECRAHPVVGKWIRGCRARARRHVTEVLAYVQFRASDLLATFRRKGRRSDGNHATGSEHFHRGLCRGTGRVHLSRRGSGQVERKNYETGVGRHEDDGCQMSSRFLTPSVILQSANSSLAVFSAPFLRSAALYFFPVDHVPPCRDVVRPLVLVSQIVGMLPDIQPKKRSRTFLPSKDCPGSACS